MTKPDMHKFSFAEMTSNSDGKTSGSGTVGIFAAFAGIVVFLMGAGLHVRNNDTDLLNQGVIMLSLGAGLLGWRKHKQKTT